MTTHRHRRDSVSRRIVPFRGARVRVSGLLLAVLAGCSHQQQADTGEDLRPDPILVRVKNENFLDMNVSVVISGVARRLGLVNGNNAASFTIPWTAAYGQPIYLRAVPIGGNGSVTSGALNVGMGQAVEFKIATLLRQSTAIIYDP